jgi:predicted DNA-binding WGR domain protein
MVAIIRGCQVDYRDPEGKRIMKCFPKKADAEAYLGKVTAAKREERYYDVFDVKKEAQVTFNELADRYVENFQSQRCFSRLKYYLVDEIPGGFW